jgi:hypothetical protein
MVSMRAVTKSFTNAGSAVACLYVESEAVSPDEIDGPWQEYNSTSGQTEPDFVRSRVMLKSHRVLFSSCP